METGQLTLKISVRSRALVIIAVLIHRFSDWLLEKAFKFEVGNK